MSRSSPICRVDGCQNRKVEYRSRKSDKVIRYSYCNEHAREKAREAAKKRPKQKKIKTICSVAGCESSRYTYISKEGVTISTAYCSRHNSVNARWDRKYFGLDRIPDGASCEICGRTKNLVFDHDHDTGLPRGILCRSCNTGLGCLGDNIGGLKMAIEYLEKEKRMFQFMPPRKRKSNLSEDDVRDIRARWTGSRASSRLLAEHFEVSVNTIYHIVNRRTWRKVK